MPRQQTIRPALDWSHDLLAPDERALFRRLGIFPGSFDLDAAEAVAPDLPVLDLLPVLVEKSLVTTRPGEDSSLRYRLLESLRAYALEHLEAAGELPDARRRHLDHYADLGERAYREGRMGSGPWAARIEIEHGNLGAALDFALRHSRTAPRARRLGLRILVGHPPSRRGQAPTSGRATEPAAP